MAEFIIPTKPEDLAEEDCELPLKVSNVTSLKELSPESLKRFTQGRFIPQQTSQSLWDQPLQYRFGGIKFSVKIRHLPDGSHGDP